MFLIFDTETTGLPKNFKAPLNDFDNWPRCIQIAWQLHDENGDLLEHDDFLVKPDGFDIPFDSEKIHGISTELAQKQGAEIGEILAKFEEVLAKTKFLAGQNIEFDLNILGCEFLRAGKENPLTKYKTLDTCTETTADLLKLPGGRGGKFKLPNLSELHSYLFGHGFDEAHNATADVEATTRCLLELIRTGTFSAKDLDVTEDFLSKFKENHTKPFQPIGLKHLNLKEESRKLRELSATEELSGKEKKKNLEILENVEFVHLHNHSQFSILQSTSAIKDLVKKAAEYKMSALALTDSGNMVGAFNMVQEVSNYNKNKENPEEKIKAILGCELFVCNNRTDKTNKDNGGQVVFLAKNKKGYHNIAKLSSIGFKEGFYYVPRVDKEVILEYKEDVIVLSGGRFGEIPSLILNVGEQQAEEALLWWKEQFGEDFYLELVNHGLEEEKRLNDTLIKFSNKYNIKCVATNNTFYVNQSDADSHDLLLCLKEGEKQATPIGRGRGYRYGFPNSEYYFKNQDEMKELFLDYPDAIINVKEIVDKIEEYELRRPVLLPKFDIPEEFINPKDAEDEGKRGENAYLRHLAFEGAKRRYGEITDEIKTRLDFELETIERTGYPGYFLIVQDFTNQARKMGVAVGPGRGSAAGSAVAYCIGITNVDPIKYDLLFERFLNPDRVSLPDIDIDFDDEGRDRIIKWVVDKYGYNQVAQIITYGTMAAKSSIKDAARVLDLPLSDSENLSKLMPDIKLAKLFTMTDKELKENAKDKYADAEKLREKYNSRNGLEFETIEKAIELEGQIRNTGIHPCGVIIAPCDISNLVPVAIAKDSDLMVTQFDNHVVEPAGLLKMDFLGLKTLTLIRDSLTIIKKRHGIEIDPDEIPLDDPKTYELFQKGATVGIFQYESPGMQKHLKELKPTQFADLIAMNALYRPGPMEYIPSFINRKNGIEKVSYDLAEMQEFLEETYGITVYQEQVMLLSQKLANFSKGEADTLRKAMGKKDINLLEKLKPKFFEGGKTNGHEEQILEKIWHDWEAFASYAFNKSHSTCYAYIAFQTAYLKANYPAEYMASVLSNNKNDIKQVTFFMDECKRMKLNVLGPDVNESFVDFMVNKAGDIRFGMAAIKGVGKAAVESIIKEREARGNFVSIFDFVERVDLRAVNKKSLEALALAGGFDCFTEIKRYQFFEQDEDGVQFVERLIRFGNKMKEDKNTTQQTLFGDSIDIEVSIPQIQVGKEWSPIEKLEKEKEVVGIFLSAHPLDPYKLELSFLTTHKISDLKDLESLLNKDITIGGMVTEAQVDIYSKNGNKYGFFILEDYFGSYKFMFFGQDYATYKNFIAQGFHLLISARIQKRAYANKDGILETEIKIKKIHMLSDARKDLIKGVTISIDVNDVDSNLINQLEAVSIENKGDKKLKFKIIDKNNNIKIGMFSRNYCVNLSEKFTNFLLNNPNLEFIFEK
ncbi:MAG: DNA polymerase III subunit alpha [Bacteroidales bacterium]|nr:DNA polymerase III subunit alpha [Bacteroidales bacterium]